MVSNPGNRWAVAASTFLVWGGVAASAVYWGMKLSSGADTSSVAPAVRTAPPPDPAAIARLLGSSPVAAAAAPVASLSSRFQLLGVVAGPEGAGAALIAVDGKPPKPYRVGAQVDESFVLQSVDPRHASIGPSLKAPAAVTLELPLKR
ncbi:MAG TPA: type II secretion system protein N [Ramlibacter sp.]|nr:type II secretion system protein N [Ramlibacter sp.]